MMRSQRASGVPGTSIFLATPNSITVRPVVDDLVVPVLSAAGHDVVRVPTGAHSDIVNEIIDKIGRCDGVVGITIGKNANVFWELGYAFAIRKPIILLGDEEQEFGLLVNEVRCVRRCTNGAETRRRFSLAVLDVMGARARSAHIQGR